MYARMGFELVKTEGKSGDQHNAPRGYLGERKTSSDWGHHCYQSLLTKALVALLSLPASFSIFSRSPLEKPPHH